MLLSLQHYRKASYLLLAIAFNKVVYCSLASMFLIGSRNAFASIGHLSNFAQSDHVAAALHTPITISTMGTNNGLG